MKFYTSMLKSLEPFFSKKSSQITERVTPTVTLKMPGTI